MTDLPGPRRRRHRLRRADERRPHVQTLEDAGLAGCHIEDQVNPKRCGHLDGKAVVDEDTAIKRIRAAVDARRDPNFLIMARTDIRAVEGSTPRIDRAKALVDAGADAIFPEAMRTSSEFEAVRAAVDVPMLANMTEFGKSELFTVDAAAGRRRQHRHLPGHRCCASRWARRSVRWTRSTPTGTHEAQVGEMQHPRRLYELLDYEAYNHFDPASSTSRSRRSARTRLRPQGTKEQHD